MYNVPMILNGKLKVNKSVEGESIEQKIERIMNNKEGIKDGAPLIYTDRKDGVRPEYNPRTDRFEVAIEAMDKVQKSYKARREERAGQVGNVGKPESIQGKPETGNADNR